MVKAAAIIPAAGQGKRMGNQLNKQFLSLGGLPLLLRTCLALAQVQEFRQLIIVARPGEEDEISRLLSSLIQAETRRWQIVTGGEERQHSVWNGLQQIAKETELVAIHDGARPLIQPDTVRAALQEAAEFGAVVVGVPVKDTIKTVDGQGIILATPERKSLWAVQTPQVFRRDWLLTAYYQAWQEGFVGTDDSVLVERAGYRVKMLRGDYTNLKITTPEDLLIAEALLQARGGM